MEHLSHVKKLRESAETARVGVKWTEEESDRVLDAFRNAPAIDDKFLAQCARDHHRTPEGICAHVESVAVRALRADLAIENACDLTGLPMEQILAALEVDNKARYARALRKIRKMLAKFDYDQRVHLIGEISAAP